LSIPSGSWRFAGPNLSAAVQTWTEREHPSEEQINAFYDWCLATIEVGPAHNDTIPVLDEDTFISYVPVAEVIVTYLAILQDRSIFIRSIAGLAE
jgi:hypothetical protein